ncbi:hypothetical protein PI125_g19056 [Phytophthora idaei]|nr:hypothetical protein PI125_g19056 [Phytophthora idaei]
MTSNSRNTSRRFEERLEAAVHPLCLAVRFRMDRRRHQRSRSQKLEELRPEGLREARVAVKDDGFGQAVMTEDGVDEVHRGSSRDAPE